MVLTLKRGEWASYAMIDLKRVDDFHKPRGSSSLDPKARKPLISNGLLK